MSSSEDPKQSDRNGDSPSVGPRRLRVQVAAVAALILALAFLAGLLFMIAGDPIGWVLAPLWVFGIAFFGWILMTRRGYRRLLGVPVVVAFFLLCMWAYDHKVASPVLIGVLGLFGLVARYAMRHSRTPIHIVRRYGRPAEPASSGVLIINPNSGGGKAERFNLPEEARKRNIEPLLLGRGDDLCDLATGAVTRGADVIGMAGGDGSQALVASVAMNHDVAHVCVPAGTRNHFALDLGINRDDVVGALDAFTDGVERRIDLASLNGRVFVNNASLGVYAGVVQSDAYRDAKLGTWKRMLPEIVGRGPVVSALHFDGPHRKDWPNASLVNVSNNVSDATAFWYGHATSSRQRSTGHLCGTTPRGGRSSQARDSLDNRSLGRLLGPAPA